MTSKMVLFRTPMEPTVTYSDDPLRMLRAIRFATQLNFKIEDKSIIAIKKNAHRIAIISKERIVDELHKIVLTTQPSSGFLMLEQNDLLERILPELIQLKGIDEIEGKSHKDNFYHTLEVVDNISNTQKIFGSVGQHCYTILERHRLKNFTLKLDGLFMGTSSLAPKWCINFSSVLKCH